MNIAEILQQHARNYPRDVALIDRHRGRNRSHTYAELDEAAARMAALLQQSGLSPGDRVLLFHTMSAELYTALAAIFRLGLTAMFVDPSAGRHHLNRCCAQSPPRALIAGSKAHLLRVTSSAVRRIPIRFSIGGRVPFATPIEKSTSLAGNNTIYAATADTPALVSLTSGSTGEPKAAMRTHGFLLAQHRAIERSLSLRPGDVELVTLPIFVLANLASRVTSLIADADLRRPDEIDPLPVITQIRAHAATRFAASPAFHERIAGWCETRKVRLPTLRRVLTGGGPVSLQLLDRLQRIAPQATITAVYGSTEAEPISVLDLNDIEDEDRLAIRGGRGLLAGCPDPSLNVRIMQDRWGHPLDAMTAATFDDFCQKPASAGEIVVSGDHVLPGYLNGQGDADNKFRVDGAVWHRTGDAGYFDDHGRLWLLGRCESRIEDSAGRFYPLGVEQMAQQHPAIDKAAVIAHEGKRLLAVSLMDAEEPPDLSSLQQSLSFAAIDSICVLDRLPVDRRHNSKIDYPALHALLER